MISNLLSGRPLLAAAILVASCLAGHAATVSVTAVADTGLFANHPDSNLGAATLVAGTNQLYSRSRSLILFDVSAIPAGSIVTGVQFTLSVTRRPDPDQHTGPLDSDFSLSRMLVGWGEGRGGEVTGSNPQPGDATWDERHFGSASWTTPGGQVGTDYANDPSTTTSISGVGPYIWGSTPAFVSDIQSWVDDPSTNFGLILISQNEADPGTARRFSSREALSGGSAAQLIITVSDVPEPGCATLLLVAAGVLGVRRRRRHAA